jgi:hypothetical protein
MIRPFTCLVFLLACGSGLYLYQSKHRVSLLDGQIAQTVKSTDVLRAQTRMLSAEWTLLNDPERLRQLASQFLTLQTVSPNQFTSLADLDSRLPPPVPPGPPPETPNDVGGTMPTVQGPVPMASAGSGGTGQNEGRPGDAKVAEAPSLAAPKAAMASAQAASPSPARVAMIAPAEPLHPAERKPSVPRLASVTVPPRPVISQPRPPDQREAVLRSAELRGTAPRLAEARSLVSAPRMPAPMPMSSGGGQGGGSLLGMAHGVGSPPLALPRPMPMSAPQWSYSNGG